MLPCHIIQMNCTLIILKSWFLKYVQNTEMLMYSSLVVRETQEEEAKERKGWKQTEESCFSLHVMV